MELSRDVQPLLDDSQSDSSVAEAAPASVLQAARKPQALEEAMCGALPADGLLPQTKWLERMRPAAPPEQFRLGALQEDVQLVSLRELLLGLRALQLALFARSL